MCVRRWVRHPRAERQGTKRKFKGSTLRCVATVQRTVSLILHAHRDVQQQLVQPMRGWAVEWSLWCMNPAVAFGDLARPTRCVVLTSGTLAPLDSFASELGAAFDVRLEAPHVVDMSRQVWVGAVGAAPSGAPLTINFKSTDQLQTQARRIQLLY